MVIMNHGVRTLDTLGLIARIVLIGFIAACGITFAIQLVTMFAGAWVMANAGPIALIAGLAGVLQLILFMVSVAVIAMWVHRAHANLHEAQLQGLHYSPGWATASFFIPFVNLYLPFASTRELYNRSHGESDWHAAGAVGDVTSWASCNWGALVVFLVAAGYFAVNSVPGLYVLLPDWAWVLMFALLYLLVAGSAFYLLQIVRKVTAAQVAGMQFGTADTFA